MIQRIMNARKMFYSGNQIKDLCNVSNKKDCLTTFPNTKKRVDDMTEQSISDKLEGCLEI